jgi:hypothetical protein
VTTAHHNGHEHELEPQFGLPEALPAGEAILWQGVPERSRIARDVFHLRAVALYFLVIVALRFTFQYHDSGSLAEAVAAATWLMPIFATGYLILWVLAHLVARTTVYTITDRRVVMRVGIVLCLTFNIPFKRIQAAQVRRRRDGGGDIALELVSGDKIAWPHLWPHVRPWRLAFPQPMLRGLPEIDRPARLLQEAWLARSADRAESDAAANGLVGGAAVAAGGAYGSGDASSHAVLSGHSGAGHVAAH